MYFLKILQLIEHSETDDNENEDNQIAKHCE